MTRYLHHVISSRASWNTTVLLSDQAIRELLFWGDNLRPLNGVLFRPLVFVPSRSRVVVSDASFTGCVAFR